MTIHSSISIIIPVFNGLPYVTQAVDSVLNQTQSSWELLISDNGSTDGTHNYLQRLKTSGDRRIKIFEQDQNIGIFGNLNFLINNAEADVIQIVCADDFLSSPSSLDTILGFWNTADINTSAVRWNGKKLLSIGVPTFIKPDVSQLYFFLFGNLFGNLSCASFRKKAITAAKSFDQSYPYAGDFEFWARLAKNSSFVIHELDTVVIRAHPGQASNYLNLNGDLYPQLSTITSQIFENIGNQNRFVRLLLKSLELLFMTANTGSPPFDTLSKAIQYPCKSWIKPAKKVHMSSPNLPRMLYSLWLSAESWGRRQWLLSA